MEITIFSSKKTSKTGNSFFVYVTKLLNKATGEEEYFKVKFREEDCRKPDGNKCPMNIIVEKDDCHISIKEKEYEDTETGETGTYTDRIIWVSNWSEGSPYVDTSTDNYF